MSSSNLLPDLPNYDPKPADGVRVGESPAPGLTLKRILRGHTESIKRIAWLRSPDKLLLASPSKDRSVRIWDCESGEIKKELAHDAWVNCASWSLVFYHFEGRALTPFYYAIANRQNLR